MHLEMVSVKSLLQYYLNVDMIEMHMLYLK